MVRFLLYLLIREPYEKMEFDVSHFLYRYKYIKVSKDIFIEKAALDSLKDEELFNELKKYREILRKDNSYITRYLCLTDAISFQNEVMGHYFEKAKACLLVDFQLSHHGNLPYRADRYDPNKLWMEYLPIKVIVRKANSKKEMYKYFQYNPLTRYNMIDEVSTSEFCFLSKDFAKNVIGVNKNLLVNIKHLLDYEEFDSIVYKSLASNMLVFKLKDGRTIKCSLLDRGTSYTRDRFLPGLFFNVYNSFEEYSAKETDLLPLIKIFGLSILEEDKYQKYSLNEYELIVERQSFLKNCTENKFKINYPVIVSQDKTDRGEVLRLYFREEEYLQYLKVQDVTPQLVDGKNIRKVYKLGVPPNISSVDRAIAYTFAEDPPLIFNEET